jgi:hypothetical protein
MKDRLLIEKINPKFSALNATAIHHCLSAWKTVEHMNLPEFGPGGGVELGCNTRNINHRVNNVWIDACCHLEVDFCSTSPQVQAKMIDNICSMIR